MSTLRATAHVSSGDRFAVMVFIAALLHMFAILGIGFDFSFGEMRPTPLTLDITLVHHRDETPPEKADYLAQANQDGGGNTEEPVRPQGPLSIPSNDPTPGDAVATVIAAPPPPPPPPAPLETLVRETPRAPPKPPPPPPLPAEDPLRTTAAELIQRSRQMASLAAEIRDNFQVHAQRPRKKQVTARTQEYAYASYLEAWRSKVERIGNLNYPDEAKRRQLSGSLMLQVDLRPDGSILDVVLLRSSGVKILDDAAIRIVRLAAPYAPFPPSIREEVDVLQIIRTWQFMSNNRLSSG
jgi:protein TonB